MMHCVIKVTFIPFIGDKCHIKKLKSYGTDLTNHTISRHLLSLPITPYHSWCNCNLQCNLLLTLVQPTKLFLWFRSPTGCESRNIRNNCYSVLYPRFTDNRWCSYTEAQWGTGPTISLCGPTISISTYHMN